MAVRISTSCLAASVASCGGIGVIGGSGMQKNELSYEIKRAKEMSRGIIGVNLMVALKNFNELALWALRSGADVLLVGAGFSRDIFRLGQKFKTPIITIVSSAKAAQLAENCGALAIVVEGKEAGGHLGTEEPLFKILPEIVKKVKIPVFAAGGIISPIDVRRALVLGAFGIQVGTRFALTYECNAHQNWKEALLKATKKDLVLLKTPVGMTFRAIKNYFVAEVTKGQSFKELSEAFETKVCQQCLRNCDRTKFCILHALERAQEGDITTGLITCGERVGEINDILSVQNIFEQLTLAFKA